MKPTASIATAPTKREAARTRKTQTKSSDTSPTPRTTPKKASIKTASGGADTKLSMLVVMLRHKRGASIDQLAKATGWQKHSVRGAISGALKKRLGLNVVAEKSDTGRIYRIAK